eukprot:TRINITY_DN2567_c0_g1_i4.p1 TRINITY_DN2567_c0_g1~~TRINITY_DN2567_c0_g1_i4.p1  ORF type:complete len:558 (-),score=138.21 TRINITY_DN2567_c0_g1_i4:132-1805(-)
MNPQLIAEALRISYESTVDEQRKQIEAQLDTWASVEPQFPIMLLQICANQEVSLDTRNSAATIFKRYVNQRWVPRETDDPNGFSISQEIKEVIKTNIVGCIVQVPDKLKQQLSDALGKIIDCDFPGNFPILIPTIIEFLNSALTSNDEAVQYMVLYGTLYTVRKIIRRFENKSHPQREPLEMIVAQTFPLLTRISNQIIGRTIEKPSDFGGSLVLLLVKIFYASSSHDPPKYFEQVVNNSGGPAELLWWVRVSHELLRMAIPPGSPDDSGLDAKLGTLGEGPELEEKRHKADSWIWWKIKKWSMHILNRFFDKFGGLEIVGEGGDQRGHIVFANDFRRDVVPSLLETVFGLMVRNRKSLCAVEGKMYIPDKLLALLFNCFGNAVKYSQSYKIVKNFCGKFICEILYPIVCFSNKDLEIWNDDPSEFLRREWDYMEDYWDPKPCGVNVLVDLLTYRKGNYLNVVAQMCMQVLKNYSDQVGLLKQSGNTKLLLEISSDKEGALYLLGNLTRFLGSEQEFAKGLEGFLTAHVITELDNPLAFMRSRAAATLGEFYRVVEF